MVQRTHPNELLPLRIKNFSSFSHLCGSSAPDPAGRDTKTASPTPELSECTVEPSAAIHAHQHLMASNSRTGRQDSPPQSYARGPPPPQQPQPVSPGTAPAAQPGMMQTPYMQQAPQAPYWPPAEPVYMVGVHELIINQVHYYFSPENLLRDEFLRSQMDPHEGWLPIPLLATFNRLRSLAPDPNLIAEVRAPPGRAHSRARARLPPRTSALALLIV